MLGKFESLLPWVIPDIPNCTEPALIKALGDAWSDFCRDSEAWRERLPPIGLEAGNRVYPLRVPYQALIHAVLKVWIRSAGDVAAGNDGTLLGTAQYDLSEGYDNTLSITLKQKPATSVDAGLVVRVVIMPAMDATEPPPQGMINRWGDVIANKAKADLAMEDGQPWTNRAVAKREASNYANGIARARKENIRGRNQARPMGLEA